MDDFPQSIEECKQWMESPDWEVRRQAIKSVRTLGWTDAVPRLQELLCEDESAAIRSTAAKELGKLGASDAIDALAKAAQDPVNTVRGASIRALGKLRALDAIDVLHTACSDVDWHVRSAAVGALGKLLRPESLPYIIPLLDHEEEILRNAARKTLGRYGLGIESQELAELMTRLSDTGYEDAGTVEWEVQDSLLLRLYSKDERVVLRAATSLGKSRNNRVLSELVKAVSREPKVAPHVAHLVMNAASGERLALLRSLLHETLFRHSMWSIIRQLLAQWPEEEKELVCTYLDAHLDSWKDEDRSIMCSKLQDLQQPAFFHAWPLARALHFYPYGKELDGLAESMARFLENRDTFPIKQLLFGYALTNERLDLLPDVVKCFPMEQVERISMQGTIQNVDALERTDAFLSSVPHCKELHLSLLGNIALQERLLEKDCLDRISHLELSEHYNQEALSLRTLPKLLQATTKGQLTSLSVQGGWGGSSNRHLNANDLVNIADVPEWGRLTKLSFERQFQHHENVKTFFQTANCKGLTSLSVHLGSPDASLPILDAVLEPGRFPMLEELRLEAQQFTALFLQRLAKWPQLGQLTCLTMPYTSSLFSKEQSLSVEAVLEFLDAPFSDKLRFLRFPRFFEDDALLLRKAIDAHPLMSSVAVFF